MISRRSALFLILLVAPIAASPSLLGQTSTARPTGNLTTDIVEKTLTPGMPRTDVEEWLRSWKVQFSDFPPDRYAVIFRNIPVPAGTVRITTGFSPPVPSDAISGDFIDIHIYFDAQDRVLKTLALQTSYIE